MTPDVSVIVAAYNTESYIETALRSALWQEGVQVEVIVVDDQSTDRTPEVVRGISDERIRLLRNETNQGPSAARNRALDAADGTWIAILDSDDWFAPGRLRAMLDAVQEAGAEMVADDMHLIADGAAEPHTTHFGMADQTMTEPMVVDALTFIQTNRPGLPGLRLGAMKPLIRRRWIEDHGVRYNESVHFAEDFQFYVRLLVEGARMLVLPEAYYYRRSRPGSLAAGDKADLLEHDVEASAQFLEHPSVRDAPRVREALRNRLEIARDHLAYRRFRKALRERRLDLLPTSPRNVIRLLRFIFRMFAASL